MRVIIFIFIFILCAQTSFSRSSAGSLKGQVTDQLGAVIVGAEVSLTSANGAGKIVKTDGEGRFIFSNLAFGSYILRATAKNFALFEQTNVEISANSTRREIDVQLNVAVEQQEVSVGGENNLSVESQNNAGAIILRDDELEILPESPEELEAALRFLAGVPIGPDGGQILIDGFVNTGQPLPDRNSIREVRINQNPFSAENDRVGFGQIQIITRPGTEKWTGSLFFNFNDESLNSRSPFAANRAPYQLRNYGGTVSGAVVPQRASFFAAFQKRDTDDNALVNATLLDENLNVAQFNRIVLTPRRQTSFNSRFDFQITSNHTLAASYSFYQLSGENFGIGGFSLPERGYDVTMPIHTFQLSETAVIRSKYVNEFRLQYTGENRFDNDANTQPTINVLGAFISGGAGIGLARNPEGRLTVQNSVLWTAGRHTLRAGARLRRTTITDVSPDFFNGSFTFGGGLAPRLDANGEIVRDANGQIIFETITSLERCRRTLLFQRRGLSPSEIRARGGGNPLAIAEQIDFGTYFQDDWRVTPTFTLALGLRYEVQTNINQNLNLAPRVSFVWIPKFANADVQKPTTVVRGGLGIFFDRFGENQVLISNKYAANDYFQFVTTDPQFTNAFPVAPSIEQLRQTLGGQRTVWRIASFRATSARRRDFSRSIST